MLLSGLFKKKVADIEGRLNAEWGDDNVVFTISKVLFEDGTFCWVDGEHDNPFIAGGQKDMPLVRDFSEAYKKLWGIDG